MNCEIIAVGDEVLTGDILNTNAQYIAACLEDAGARVLRQTVVGDDPAQIRQALAAALNRCDIVITTGGLGPTYDDITKEAAAELMGVPLRRNGEILQELYRYFADTHREMTKNNLKQADIPEGASPLPNPNGTAPGILLQKDGKLLIQLPGPPREMRPMFYHHALPVIAGLTGEKRVSRTLKIYGFPEAVVESRLHGMMLASHNPTIAPYVGGGEVQIRLRAHASTAEEAYELTQPAADEIHALFGLNNYSADGESLAEVLVHTLTARGLRAATAESCTGGMVSAAITSVPGSSAVFDGGVCSYSNQIKTQLLGVRPETLEQYGAVSEQCAAEMADGVRRLMNADLGVSVTGIAGPGGGSVEKPVGTVCFGISTPKGTAALRRNYRSTGDDVRENSRTRATMEALFLLLQAALDTEEADKNG